MSVINVRQLRRVSVASLVLGAGISGVTFGVFRHELPGPGDVVADQVRSVPVANASFRRQIPVAQMQQIEALTDPQTLSAAEADRVPGALVTLSGTERFQFDQLLKVARSDTERAYIYKALAAARKLPDITAFAAQVRGTDPGQLVAELNPTAPLTPLDTVANSPLRQLLDDTCAATEAQLMRALADPVYAKSLYDQGAYRGVAVQKAQAEILAREGSNTAKNTPFPFSIIGLSNRAQMDEYNALTPSTGIHYRMYNVTASDANAAYSALIGALRNGVVVPMDVGDATGIRHATMILATQNDEILVHDPGYGDTGWFTRAQFVHSMLNYFQPGSGNGAGGWTSAWRIVLPSDHAAPGLEPTLIVAPQIPGLLFWLGIVLATVAVGAVGDVGVQLTQDVVNRHRASEPQLAGE